MQLMGNVGDLFSSMLESLDDVEERSRELSGAVGDRDGGPNNPDDFGHVSILVFNRPGLGLFEDEEKEPKTPREFA
jgi:hypothetical protein